MIYINEVGDLTDIGAHSIKSTFNLNDDLNSIKIAWNTRSNSAWFESLIKEEVKSTFQLSPANLISSESLSRIPALERNLFSSDDRQISAVTGISISSIAKYLIAVDILETPDLFIPLVDGEQITINNLRQNKQNIRLWSTLKYLAYAIKGDKDQSLKNSYVAAHNYFFSQKYEDPLTLVTPAELNSRDSTRPRRSQLNLLPGTSYPENQRLSFVTLANAIEGNHASPIFSELQRIQVWYTFLFGNLPPIVRRFQENVQRSFIASDINVLRTYMANFNDIRSFPSPRDEVRGMRLLFNKQPDIVVISHRERIIRVLDPTFRPVVLWHNFKTELYCSVLRTLLRNKNPPWRVEGYDYGRRRLQMTSTN